MRHSEETPESPSEALPSEALPSGSTLGATSGAQISASRRKFSIPDEIFGTRCENELPTSYIWSVLAINSLVIGFNCTKCTTGKISVENYKNNGIA